jgi:hypothetical protein
MISLRTIAIALGVIGFAQWAVINLGPWTWFITMPLCAYAGLAAAALDKREGRRP